jgi:ankyrin repeat protein
MGCVQFSAKTSPEGEAEARSLQALGFSNLSEASNATAVNAFMPAKHNPALKQCAIHGAALAGDVAAAQWLQRKGADLRARNSFDQSPLMLALQRGHVPLAAFLYDATLGSAVGASSLEGGDLASRCSGGSTALHLAAQQRRSVAVAWALDKLPRLSEGGLSGAVVPTVDLPDNHGDSPLLLACAAGSVDVCRRLWAHSQVNPRNAPKSNANVAENASSSFAAPNFDNRESDDIINRSGSSYLSDREGGLSLPVSSAGLPPLPLHVNVDGSTLAHYACLSGDPAVLHWLFGSALLPATLKEASLGGVLVQPPGGGGGVVSFGAGASPASPALLFVSDRAGRSPLQVAAAWGHVGCCAVLVAWGALISPGSGDRSDQKVLDRDVPTADPEALVAAAVLDAAAAVETGAAIRPLEGRLRMPGRTGSSTARRLTGSSSGRPPLVPGPPASAAAAVCVDVRAALRLWAAAELTFADTFLGVFLASTLKTKKGAVSSGEGGGCEQGGEMDSRVVSACFVERLRKADRKTRHVPRMLIADFAGVSYGRRRRLVREALGLLNQAAPA